MADEVPFYVYKLISSSHPVHHPLPERLPVSDIDQQSGFIHLSTAFQLPNTLKSFFTDEPLVYALRIEYHNVEQDIRWETPEGNVCGPRPNEGLFPHLYNGLKLGRSEVESLAVWKNEEGWEKALKQARPWLLY